MNLFDEANTKKILEASNIGLWRVEFEEGQLPRFYADAVMSELLGIPGDVTPQERFRVHHTYIHPDDLRMFEEYSDKLAEDRTEVVYRYIHPVKGEMFVRCAGVRDLSVTDYLSFHGTHQDISDTIRYEKERYAETRLAEVAAAKENALKKAKRASAAKTEFLARMSHDIRTPLNGIIGILEINEAHSDEKELVVANRKKAKVAAQHLLSLINDVLDMTKLEDESVELVNEPIDLMNICIDTLTICNIRAKENGITLIHDNGANLKYPKVYGSELQLKRILMNLLNNCVKYNKPGGKVLCSSDILSVDENQVIYKFEISDTGIGMSKEFLKHIFEPFAQEKEGARSNFQGNGMGMPIVKKLVELMNGTIGVESTKGEGTKFTLILPFEIDKETAQAEKDSEKGMVSLKGARILLAEDNDLNAEIAQCLLEDAGATVTVAENGEVAFNLFSRKPQGSYDMILMDIMMPVLDGYGATKKIREYDREDAKLIPIIAMTANAFAEDVQKAKDAGMNDHLSKPIQVDLLMNTISHFVK